MKKLIVLASLLVGVLGVNSGAYAMQGPAIAHTEIATAAPNLGTPNPNQATVASGQLVCAKAGTQEYISGPSSACCVNGSMTLGTVGLGGFKLVRTLPCS